MPRRKQRFERDYLVGLLKLTDGNVADAARLADRNRTEFYRLLQKHGLTPGHFQAATSDARRACRRRATAAQSGLIAGATRRRRRAVAGWRQNRVPGPPQSGFVQLVTRHPSD